MSKLDEMIRELCPDGVEYKTLGEIAVDIYRGAGITRDQVTAEGTPCVRYGEIYTTYGVWFDKCVSHTDESKLLSKKYFEHGDILFAITGESVDDIAKCCVYIGHEKCLAGGDIVVLKHNQNPKYLSYALATTDARQQKSKGKVKSKVVHSSVPAIREIKVPVPPIEIQREIVRILDDYTENVTELQRQLAAEMTARKTQYSFYRDKLLTFNTPVEWKPMEKEFPFIRNGFVGTVTPYFTGEEQGVRYLEGTNIHDGVISDNEIIYVSKEFHQKHIRNELKDGDILMVQSGHVGECAVVDDNYAGSNCHALIIMSNAGRCNSRFVMHYLRSTEGKAGLKKITTGGTVKHILASNMKKFMIPVPPLDVQNRIVNVLDNFEKICSDLNIGLPAEIEARQKQYEYYRDKLLTFAETGNTILSRAEQSRAEQSRAEQSRALIKLLQYVFGYAMLPLSEVANVFRGEYITKKNENAGNIPVILGGQEPAYYIDRANHIGEIVAVARSGASAGFVSYWNEPIFITDGFGYEAKKEVVAPRYLYYVLKNKEAELNGMKRGAGVPHVSGERLGEINLPVPPIEEQKRVVSILDRFDAICNDLTSGLPAETEARQRQYEHYRDKLLNFKELN